MNDKKPPASTDSRPARLADVAAAAGVGPSVVSRILNEDPLLSVRPETRERVQAAARELDYRPNFLARGLRSARTMTIALVVPNLTHPVNAAIIHGANAAATERGYASLVVDASEFFASGQAFTNLLREHRVDGVLVAGASDDATSRDLLDDLMRLRFPFVLANRRLPGIEPYVVLDDAAGMELAVDHLVGLGHRRVALISGPATADTAVRRLEGFRRGMRKAGRRIAREHVVESTVEEEGGFRAMEALLGLARRPTAVAVWSLGAAVGALAAARRTGLTMPRDLSVVAFHDAPIAAYLDPPLTTVQMALGRMAEESVGLLLDQINGEQVSSRVIDVPPVLVLRDSTSTPAGGA
ncbi:Transcriptional regulator [Gaiella occulta]|uniref:Transcriptional regulator n=1 Tax=Gaiella occulta TaxID=1002870 RepID=A0A7M2YUT7_9ACTN|nr:LacI family DNA-binding transcriptional regulator [Gaiella occulta]RDI73624.1 Transcriptional regulator [Gaiella occulta]